MPTLDDVYRKFGETSEAAQLLETELGTMLLTFECVSEELIENPCPEKATLLYKQINKHTLGQLTKKLNQIASITHLEGLLGEALAVRNRLAHSFYLKHNLRRNSDDGRAVMMKDLESMHDKLLEAYKAVMLVAGIDLNKLAAEHGNEPQPATHLPI
jgi:hypothetical protein